MLGPLFLDKEMKLKIKILIFVLQKNHPVYAMARNLQQQVRLNTFSGHWTSGQLPQAWGQHLMFFGYYYKSNAFLHFSAEILPDNQNQCFISNKFIFLQ